MIDGQNFGAPSPRSLHHSLASHPMRFDERAEDRPGIAPSRPMVPIIPEGEAILQPPMDNTPNESPETEVPSRVPHIGHALLFLALTGSMLVISQLLFLGFTHPHTRAQAVQVAENAPPKLVIGSEALTYLATLVLSYYFFPILWRRPFTVGLQTNGPAATRNALRLIPIGITLSFVVQAMSALITMPKEIPMDDFFRAPSDVWLITAFGVLLAPLFEEVLFRGFLLPAFAIAYDWLSLPRIPAAREQWNSTNTLSRASLVFSAVVTSIFFALLHGKQTAFTWPVLLLLFCVSLVLTAVRIRLRSVLASTLVHASYNFAVFFSAFIATGGYRHLDKLTH